MVWLLFIIDLMGLFFYNKIGSIISIGDLPTTNIIEPYLYSKFIDVIVCKYKRMFRKEHENALPKRICPTSVFFMI